MWLADGSTQRRSWRLQTGRLQPASARLTQHGQRISPLWRHLSKPCSPKGRQAMQGHQTSQTRVRLT